jgi:hypothetical protein
MKVPSKKVALLISVVVLVMAFFVYPVIKNRYFAPAAPLDNEAQSDAFSQSTQQTDQNKDNLSSNENTSNNDSENSDPKISVTPADCDNECSKFKKDKELEYCEHVCGISDLYDYSDDSAPDSDTELNCDKKQGIQKDYCLKDQGISEKDFAICEQIRDESIKKTCKNRLTEDLLEEQQNSNAL